MLRAVLYDVPDQILDQYLDQHGVAGNCGRLYISLQFHFRCRDFVGNARTFSGPEFSKLNG